MINIKNEISQLKLGVFTVKNVLVKKFDCQLWQEIKNECNELAQEDSGKNLGEIDGIRAVRRLYSSVGMEPTHFRPSSEALLRRVLKGQALYQINTIVDINNLYSLKFLLPMGVYDLDKICGGITIRLGKFGESYEGIGKNKINAKGRIIMVDQEKICGGPTADSVETMITLKTRNVFLTMYAPEDYSVKEIKKYLDKAAEAMIKYNGGFLTFQRVIEI